MTVDGTVTSEQIDQRDDKSAEPSIVGLWSEIIPLANVPIHAHLLPTGRVLFWGRRQTAGSTVFDTLNEHRCFPFLWDSNAPSQSVPTSNQPKLADGSDVNLFCSGHAFLADGRLLVIGGHLFDSQGSSQTCLYEPLTDAWTASDTMNDGRWYPSALTLPDGSVLACSGSAPSGDLRKPPNNSFTNLVPQVWSDGTWRSLTLLKGLPLFPRMHVCPDGRVFMAGGNVASEFLDVTGEGTWTPGPSRAAGNREYAPSIMYEPGKVIFIGGGQDRDTMAPTNIVEIIDLNAASPTWQQTSPMHFARRQHNATLLADGSVLVVGGTRGDGFDNLASGNPVHQAELWDPKRGEWTLMAAESVDRCYHSTVVLLPDGRVLSAGGGEYAPQIDQPNDPKDSHPDAQIFSPPYLFKGPRPVIREAPERVHYGETFPVYTDHLEDIAKVHWIRLPSVTHSFDQNLRFNRLEFVKDETSLQVTAPANPNLCPPGHHMLFILNSAGVPSVARVIQISLREGTVPGINTHIRPAISKIERPASQTAVAPPGRRPVIVGVTASCPYGLSACWGGAYQALSRLHGVESVADFPNAMDSTAEVYLKHEGLPDIDVWPNEFARVANGTHPYRGVEVTLDGEVTASGDNLKIRGNEFRPEVHLKRLQPSHKIQWDLIARAPRLPTLEEQGAYDELVKSARSANDPLQLTVTGPLLKTSSRFIIEVREFRVVSQTQRQV